MKDTIKNISISELHPFPENPFSVREDTELQDSICDYGVISPLVVRPLETGGYEIISGHRRKAACEKAGIDIVPAFVREMDRDTAIIALVDSNLHREHILPSEKAHAYKLKLEAIKHQGVACDRIGHKSRELIADNADTSATQVQRYIRLTELIPPILDMVDEGNIAFSPAVELSYLAEKEQCDLLETMQSEDCTPSLSQAQRMKKLSQENRLDMDKIFSIMTEEKPNQKEQIKLKKDNIKRFFPKDYTAQQMEKVILRLLDDWKRRREQKSRNDSR